MRKLDCFVFDKRLGISIPDLQQDWELYSTEQQHNIILTWEQIRGHIPDRIKQLELLINKKQDQLNREDSFELSCSLNSEIADLASIINDLWLYYRTHQNISDNFSTEQKSHL